MTGASSTATCGSSMPPSSAPAGPPPGRGKKVEPPQQLGGPASLQLQEPADHALGRSQGGFGTKVHIVCDSKGTILAVFVTPGQRHESTAFEVVLARAQRPRPGSTRWPAQLAGDKGYTYPGIRSWLARHHIGAVIPTRKDQPPQEVFDKASYRKRNLVERVIGWFKECRALATRYDKLAVNYVAQWIIAIIHFLLRRRAKDLVSVLSDTA
jgi:transposase